MAKSKTRGVNLPVPQNRDQAATYCKEIGDAAPRGRPHRARPQRPRWPTRRPRRRPPPARTSRKIKMLTEGLKTWAEANREALTEGGRVKTADLGTGKVLWRRRRRG